MSINQSINQSIQGGCSLLKLGEFGSKIEGKLRTFEPVGIRRQGGDYVRVNILANHLYSHCKLTFKISGSVASFQNQGASNATGVANLGQISQCLTPL